MNRIFKTLAAVALAAFCVSCATKPALTLSGLDPEAFVGEKNGKATALYTLTNENGMEVCITNGDLRAIPPIPITLSILTPSRRNLSTIARAP